MIHLRPRRVAPALAIAFIVAVAPFSNVLAVTPLTVGPNVDISGFADNESETTVAVNPTNPSNVVVVSNFAVADALMEAVTFDGGATWRYVQPPPGPVAYQDLSHWWATEGTILFKSSDAGQTWTQVTNKLPDSQYLLYVLDSSHAWASVSVLGGYGLAFSGDGGLHWTRATVPLSG